MTKRILVVDDRNELLHLMRRILEDEQYQVSILKEGRDAFETIKNALPDLVLLDLKLGDISGQDILKEVKKDELTAEIPVIVYTAAVIEAEEVRRLIEGDTQLFYNVDIVKKPFELEPLLDKIDMMIEGRRRGSKR